MAEANASTDVTEKYTFFWKSDSPFSQWHPSKFTVDGQLYNCAEQYMMHEKAVLFGDYESAHAILGTSSPRKQKMLGRKVKNWNDDLWNKECQNIVHKGNVAKFSQNKDLQKILLKTAGTTLVEASPLDTIWGIGLAADDPRAWNKATWNGRNLLGYILTDVREEILQSLDATEEIIQHV
ncbi:N-glycosidase Npun_R5314-like [Lineus longissimus]|uniref:N-glycosidase Npun_R5314-like n=1 Tax=Lineus longissimus TaxID=88925 RepID=UPI002B4D2FCD